MNVLIYNPSQSRAESTEADLGGTKEFKKLTSNKVAAMSQEPHPPIETDQL